MDLGVSNNKHNHQTFAKFATQSFLWRRRMRTIICFASTLTWMQGKPGVVIWFPVVACISGRPFCTRTPQLCTCYIHFLSLLENYPSALHLLRLLSLMENYGSALHLLRLLSLMENYSSALHLLCLLSLLENYPSALHFLHLLSFSHWWRTTP